MAKNRYPYEGVLRWAKRPEWRDALEATLLEHCEFACKTLELDHEELLSSKTPLSTQLLQCALESLMAAVQDDGRNLATEYLERRGWSETPSVRGLIAAVRHSKPGLYEVFAEAGSNTPKLKDMLFARPDLRLEDSRPEFAVEPGEYVAARLIELDGKTRFSTWILPVPAEAGPELGNNLRPLLDDMRSIEDLSGTFGNMMIHNALAEEDEAPLLDEDFLPTVALLYRFRPGIAQPQLIERLSANDQLIYLEDLTWAWVDQAHEDLPILARIRLLGGLLLEVDGEEHVDQARALAEACAGDLILKREPEPVALDHELSEDEAFNTSLDRVLRALLDLAQPEFGGDTPRLAAADPARRMQVAAWLRMVEARFATTVGSNDGLYDGSWMWRELGVEDLR